MKFRSGVDVNVLICSISLLIFEIWNHVVQEKKKSIHPTVSFWQSVTRFPFKLRSILIERSRKLDLQTDFPMSGWPVLPSWATATPNILQSYTISLLFSLKKWKILHNKSSPTPQIEACLNLFSGAVSRSFCLSVTLSTVSGCQDDCIWLLSLVKRSVTAVIFGKPDS